MATSVKIDKTLKKRLDNLANKWQRSAHWIMLDAIQQYVDKEEARQTFKDEALASWSHYQETGQHLTGEEIHDWLDTWGTKDETDNPPCHN